MNEKIEKLRQCGCDIDGAMERTLNDEDFYLECAQMVLEDDNIDNLKSSLEKNDVKMAFECAHALKGILANVGFTSMLNKTVEIVEPLRAGNSDNLLQKVDELIKLREKMAEIICD